MLDINFEAINSNEPVDGRWLEVLEGWIRAVAIARIEERASHFEIRSAMMIEAIRTSLKKKYRPAGDIE